MQKCIEGGVNHNWTLSSLQLHPHAMIVVDEDATLELQVKTVKYYKSIERAANELSFQQKLPRKRDSLVDTEALLAPVAQVNGMTLAVPQLETSRSASPVLEPMNARISNEDGRVYQSMDDLEDSPSVRMSARLVG